MYNCFRKQPLYFLLSYHAQTKESRKLSGGFRKPPHGAEAAIQIQKTESPASVWITVYSRPSRPPDQEPLDGRAVHGGHITLNDPRPCQANDLKYFNFFHCFFPKTHGEPLHCCYFCHSLPLQDCHIFQHQPECCCHISMPGFQTSDRHYFYPTAFPP